MESINLLKQIEFIKEVDKLKYILRATKLLNSDRKENDAEHSWHLALMAVVLAEHANFSVDLLVNSAEGSPLRLVFRIVLATFTAHGSSVLCYL
jgi:hypothetical protein